MNEMGYFQAAWMYVWGLIKQSFVYKLLRKVYDGISGAWQRGLITNFFRREHFSPEALGSSVAGRLFAKPFGLLEELGRKAGAVIENKIAGSIVVRLANIYLHNLLALNTRFIGGLTLFAALGAAAAGIIAGAGINLALCVIAVAGALIMLTDYNLTPYLKGSWIMKIFTHLTGIEPDFNKVFNQRYTKQPSRLWLAVILGAAAGLSAYLSPLLPLLIIGGLFGLFTVLRAPLAGVYFTIFLAPLAPTMVMVGLSLLSLFSLVIKGVCDRKFRWRFDGMGFLILGMLAIYLIASIFSFAQLNSLSIFLVYMSFMLFYFVVINTVRTRKQLFDALALFVLSGALVCLYGVAQYVFGWDTASAWMDEEMFTDIKMRVYSTLENPNVLGEYILLVIPVCVGLVWERSKKLSKALYVALAGLMFLTLILTFSRGCWIGFIIVAGVYVTFVCGKLWGLALIALPFVPMLIPESIINRFVSVGDMTDSSTSYRVYIWFGTFGMLKDFWASGIGPGTQAFKSVYPFYSYSGIVAPHSHNMFLQVFVESGIVGISIFLILLFMFFKKMIGGYQCTSGKGSKLGAMIVAIAAGVLGFCVQGMFDNCFYNYRVFLIFWYVLALGMAAVYIARDEQKAVKKA